MTFRDAADDPGMLNAGTSQKSFITLLINNKVQQCLHGFLSSEQHTFISKQTAVAKLPPQLSPAMAIWS
jgi:hypothetical protein